MLVSVVIPSRNQAGFIGDCLHSITSQTHRPLEIIVVDGASTDGTVGVLRGFLAGQDVAFRWVSEPDGGHPDALNKGFAMTTGEVVGWLNSDDLYYDRCVVERAVQALRSKPEVDVVFGDTAIIDENGYVLMYWCFPKFRPRRAWRGLTLPQPSVFLRHPVILNERLDESLKVALDFEYWLRLGRKYRFAHVGAVQSVDRDQPNRISHARRGELLRTHQRIVEQYRSEYGDASPLGRCADLILRSTLRLKVVYPCLKFAAGIGSSRLCAPFKLDGIRHLLRRQLLGRLGRLPRAKAPQPA